MSSPLSYSSIGKARDGSPIPLAGSLSFHSRYNPLREAEQFAASYGKSGQEAPDFFIVPGLCGGYHIEALLKRFPGVEIVAIENSPEDIGFLSAIPCVSRLTENRHVHITSTDTLQTLLPQVFFPAEHSHLQIAPLRAWEQCFPDSAKKAADAIQQALQVISADFSVQSHFGGIWQRNILSNLLFYSRKQQDKTLHYLFDMAAPAGKTAAVIAAGPSLDTSSAKLAAERESYYIIATDTAYSALLQRRITPDACVSVDAQMISHGHFFNIAPSTLFIFDLSANPAAVRKAAAAGATIIFIETGHPISQLASHYGGGPCFPHIETGSGTVTAAAAAFAVAAGFKDIVFFGADFAYTRGKPYTKGCYLDGLYNGTSTRSCTAEGRFCSLMYRTQLLAQGKDFTTAVLSGYKKSTWDFMEKKGFESAGDGRFQKQHNDSCIRCKPFSFADFSTVFKQRLKEDRLLLLPYIAWLKQKEPKRSRKSILNLAQSTTLVYTESNEN